MITTLGRAGCPVFRYRTGDVVKPSWKFAGSNHFVMLTGGLAMVALAACLAVFDVAGWRKLARPLEIVGVNAIFVFVASGLVARLTGASRNALFKRSL